MKSNITIAFLVIVQSLRLVSATFAQPPPQWIFTQEQKCINLPTRFRTISELVTFGSQVNAASIWRGVVQTWMKKQPSRLPRSVKEFPVAANMAVFIPEMRSLFAINLLIEPKQPDAGRDLSSDISKTDIAFLKHFIDRTAQITKTKEVRAVRMFFGCADLPEVLFGRRRIIYDKVIDVDVYVENGDQMLRCRFRAALAKARESARQFPGSSVRLAILNLDAARVHPSHDLEDVFALIDTRPVNKDDFRE